jgi:hypothetical protein
LPETQSPTLREGWVFENKVLMRILRPKEDEIIGSWTELQNEELYSL